MDKFSELNATIPADKKSREAVAAGFVTDNNSGGYFVIECQECGAVYPSQQAGGGGQIADTGDYNDAICPHCGEEGPEECDNVGLAWNVQQAKIVALLAELEAKDKRIAELEQDELAMRSSSRAVHEAQENHINQQQDIIESLEKKNVDLGRALGAAEKRLAKPVRLPTEHELHQVACSECAGNCLELVERTVRAAGFTVEGDE